MTSEEAIKEVKNYDNYPNGISKECRDYIVRVLEQEPIYKSAPTLRKYEDYHDAEQYIKGWNDAMHYIFDSEEEKRKKAETEIIE